MLTVEPILEIVTRYKPDADTALISRAFEFAQRAHGEQKRKSGELYIVHPAAAAVTLANMHLDEKTIAAALLHDTIEDTTVTPEDIKKEFGEEIAFLVRGVTKLGTIKYRGAERQVETLRKMFLAMAEDIRVVLIKLADRLHNMETLEAVAQEKQRRIALETLDIYAPLAARLGIGEIKMKLDDLAFPYVYPDEHKWLIENVREVYTERQKYCEGLIPVVRELLGLANIRVLALHARAKHHFSLWQKLQRHNMELANIHDLVALRIVVPDVAACYESLGIIHKRWKPLPGRIKDYIAVPKPNGYQSLHTTVFCEGGKITEFQIRTPAMHEQAEHGIAAHWAYRESGRKAVKVGQRFMWVEQLRDWQKEVRGSEEYLESLRIDFFHDRIFVFTPKGDVVELPEGATPLDFAYHIHSQIGDSAVGGRVNDRFVGLDVALSNGDVVEIITQKGKKPSPKWLEIAKTTAARGHIRKSLRDHGIEVAPTPPQALRAEVHIAAEDRVGLLKDVSAAVASAGFNIVKIAGKAGSETGGIELVVQVPSRADIKKLLERLKKVKGVLEATGRIV